MKTFDLIRGAAMSLAAAGLLLPQGRVFAQETPSQPRVVAKADSKLAVDVVLVEGAFTGRVVDHTGTPLKNKEVVVKQGTKEVARVTTNEKGIFSAPNVRAGNYIVGSGNTAGNFRVWDEKTAPPSAKGHALLVMGENGARGQVGAVDPTLVLLTIAVIATVIISAISLDKINDVDDKVSDTPTSP